MRFPGSRKRMPSVSMAGTQTAECVGICILVGHQARFSSLAYLIGGNSGDEAHYCATPSESKTNRVVESFRC